MGNQPWIGLRLARLGRKRMREKKKRRKIGVFAVDEHVVEV
jgi:hypothetical protein